jgi:hypothetical protein
MGFGPTGYLAPAHTRGAEPTLSVVPICPPPMTSYRAAFTYVLNSVTLESQLDGGWRPRKGPVDVRGLVAYTYLLLWWVNQKYPWVYSPAGSEAVPIHPPNKWEAVQK